MEGAAEVSMSFPADANSI